MTDFSDIKQSQKLKDDQILLEAEAEARAQRVNARSQDRAVLAAKKKLERRNRVYKLTGLWGAIIFIGFIAVTWFSGDLIKIIHDLG
ncbi:MAG: hypothetical protein HQ503_09915 [Rhodospirillales bacterium]|nr:hypothetical protein [Rhodospirillales bacterium]